MTVLHIDILGFSFVSDLLNKSTLVYSMLTVLFSNVRLVLLHLLIEFDSLFHILI